MSSPSQPDPSLCVRLDATEFYAVFCRSCA